jgi:hypothetical protein
MIIVPDKEYISIERRKWNYLKDKYMGGHPMYVEAEIAFQRIDSILETLKPGDRLFALNRFGELITLKFLYTVNEEIGIVSVKEIFPLSPDRIPMCGHFSLEELMTKAELDQKIKFMPE